LVKPEISVLEANFDNATDGVWNAMRFDSLWKDINYKPYYSNQSAGVELYKEDSLELLSHMQTGSIDLIFADPPYFLSNNGITCQNGRMVSVNKGEWDESAGVKKDFEFTKQWLIECRRILKPTGSIWVSGTYHNIYSIGFAMQMLGFKILNDIAWHKVNPPPNLSCRYFTHATETLLWAKSDPKAKHKYHYKLMKQENGGRQMPSLWHITPPKLWEKRYSKHPTQKPEELLRRIILSSSDEGDLILDPFTGSGTTGVVAVRYGRAFIGIDKDKHYLDLAMKRIVDEVAAKGGGKCGR